MNNKKKYYYYYIIMYLIYSRCFCYSRRLFRALWSITVSIWQFLNIICFQCTRWVTSCSVFLFSVLSHLPSSLIHHLCLCVFVLKARTRLLDRLTWVKVVLHHLYVCWSNIPLFSQIVSHFSFFSPIFLLWHWRRPLCSMIFATSEGINYGHECGQLVMINE